MLLFLLDFNTSKTDPTFNIIDPLFDLPYKIVEYSYNYLFYITKYFLCDQ